MSIMRAIDAPSDLASISDLLFKGNRRTNEAPSRKIHVTVILRDLVMLSFHNYNPLEQGLFNS